MTHRLRCACHHAFTPDARLIEGVMRVQCRRCRRVIVAARYFGQLYFVAVLQEEADAILTVADVVLRARAA